MQSLQSTKPLKYLLCENRKRYKTERMLLAEEKRYSTEKEIWHFKGRVSSPKKRIPKKFRKGKRSLLGFPILCLPLLTCYTLNWLFLSLLMVRGYEVERGGETRKHLWLSSPPLLFSFLQWLPPQSWASPHTPSPCFQTVCSKFIFDS